MKQLDEVQRSIMLEGLRDYQSMWELCCHARDLIGSDASLDAVQRLVLGWIRPLVVSGHVAVGDLVLQGGYSDVQPWPVQGDAAMRELKDQWAQLGRDPEIGDLAWLELTPAGEAFARRLEAEG